jgi:hypothetical protein
MRNAQRRLERLEGRIRGVWPAEVEAARVRVLARVRLKIATALDVVGDARFKANIALLADDTLEKAAPDLETLRCWPRQHPMTLYRGDSARDRMAAKLVEMARWLQSGEGGDEPEDAA